MRDILYINAGAGSGKTYSLTERFADLIASGETTPSRVVLTTYTERAAAEFRLKAREMLIAKGLHSQAAELDSALIGTVHSVAMRYIMRYWYLLGLGAGVSPMPEEDTNLYISSTLTGVATAEDLDVFGQFAEKVRLLQPESSKINYDYWKADVRTLIEKADTFFVSDLKDSEAASLDLFEKMFPELLQGDPVRKLQQDVLKRVFRIARDWRSEYEAYKKAHNLVSFNDMERLFIKLLGNPVVREDIKDSVDYVFVDEFQDSNPTQVRIFDTLSDIVSKGSFWVGDPKQAIYDFRGCDTELTTAVTGIVKSRSQAKVLGYAYEILPNSWRSDPELVDLVNKAFVPVFKGQLTEKQVRLEPVREQVLPTDVPHAFHWEFEGFVKEEGGSPSYAKEYVQQGIASTVAKILRGQHKIKQVYDKDTKRVRPVQASDIAILCDSNKDCDKLSACLRNLGIPVTREVKADAGKREVAILLAVLNYFVGETSLLDAELSYLLADTDVCTLMEDKEGIRNNALFERLDAMKERLRGKSVAYIVSSVIAELDLENLVFKWGDGQASKEVLESVKGCAAKYEEQCLSVSLAATLGGFISFLTQNPVPVDISIQKGGVNVLTYHSSKGLEWGIVILYSLGQDDLNEGTFMKREYYGVNECRLNPPTEENFYSTYRLRYIPKDLSGNTNPPNPVKNVLRTCPDYSDRMEHVRGQCARLLYVGATRARDYLITVGVNKGGMKWLANLGIVSEANGKSPEGRYHVWAPDGPMSLLERIKIEGDPLEDDVKEYSVLRPAEAPMASVPKYLTPSKDFEAIVTPYTYECVFPKAGETAERISVVGSLEAYDVFGTCIHNIFAAYQPDHPEMNLDMAQETIRRYGFEQVIPKPSEVVRAADKLFAFLKNAYGKADTVHHELPFTFVDDGTGQVVVGEMDLVWETAEGCVLVDFKNYPGFENILDPASKFYVGKYASQMADYRKALLKAKKTVLDTIIYYSVLGRAVRVVDSSLLS